MKIKIKNDWFNTKNNLQKKISIRYYILKYGLPLCGLTNFFTVLLRRYKNDKI